MRTAITTLVLRCSRSGNQEGNGTGSRCHPLTARPTGGSFETGGAEDRETKSFSKPLESARHPGTSRVTYDVKTRQ